MKWWLSIYRLCSNIWMKLSFWKLKYSGTGIFGRNVLSDPFVLNYRQTTCKYCVISIIICSATSIWGWIFYQLTYVQPQAFGVEYFSHVNIRISKLICSATGIGGWTLFLRWKLKSADWNDKLILSVNSLLLLCYTCSYQCWIITMGPFVYINGFMYNINEIYVDKWSYMASCIA